MEANTVEASIKLKSALGENSQTAVDGEKQTEKKPTVMPIIDGHDYL